MRIEAWAANRLAGDMADILANGYVDVFDQDGTRLARCQFADPAFAAPIDGAVPANPFKAAVAEADGVPVSFAAHDFEDTRVLAGSAGYRDDLPPPEMKFRTRQIVKDADVLVESFVFSVIREEAAA